MFAIFLFPVFELYKTRVSSETWFFSLGDVSKNHSCCCAFHHLVIINEWTHCSLNGCSGCLHYRGVIEWELPWIFLLMSPGPMQEFIAGSQNTGMFNFTKYWQTIFQKIALIHIPLIIIRHLFIYLLATYFLLFMACGFFAHF